MLLIDRIKNLKTQPVLGGVLAVCSLAALALFLTFVLHTNTPLVAESAEIDDSVVDNLATPDPVGSPEQTTANATEQLALVIAEFPDVHVDPNLFGTPVTRLGDPMTGVEDLLARCDWCDSSELALPTFSARYDPSPNGGWVTGYGGGGSYVGGGSSGSSGSGGGGGGAKKNESETPTTDSNVTAESSDAAGHGVSADGAATSGQSNSDNTNNTDGNVPPTGPTTTTPPTKEKPKDPNAITGGGGPGGDPLKVPEPSFLLLAGVGLSSFAAARRFNRAR